MKAKRELQESYQWPVLYVGSEKAAKELQEGSFL
jgi:hypothetical protein